jgi:hypothetical protein
MSFTVTATVSQSNYALVRSMVSNSLSVFTLFSSWQGLVVAVVVGAAILGVVGSILGGSKGASESE